MSYIEFNYDTFYTYYTTGSNLIIDKTPPHAYYYPETDSKHPEYKQLSNNYILINKHRVYITQYKKNNNKKELLFSIPIIKDDTQHLWNDHYHFGVNLIRDYTKSTKELFPAVFFHKSIQTPNKGKLNESCYFSPIMDIDLKSFEQLKCLQRGNKMEELYLPEDFIYVKEIISRPFPEKIKKTFLEAFDTVKKPSGKGGTKKKTRRHRRKSIRSRCLLITK
jgi:hypothetical protein